MEAKQSKLKSIFSWVSLILVSAIVGFVLPIAIMESLPDLTFWDFILAIFVLILSVPLHVILHEVGHLIGGFLSGYQFIMFRLFNTVWIKTTDGLSKRKQHIQGILGQALMVPPEGDDTPPFLLYHASGFLMNLLTALVLIVWGYFLSSDSLTLALYVSAFVALFLFITNMIPRKPNDGYNLMYFYNNPEALDEMTDILLLYSGMVKGESFTSLQKYIDLKAIERIENPNSVTLYSAQAAAYLEQYDFEGARTIYEKLWTNRASVLEPHKPEVYLNYLFCLLLVDPHHPDVTKIKETATYKRYQQLKLADRIKITAAEALYLEKDPSKATELLKEGRPLIDSAPTLSEEKLEHQLYDYLLKDIQRMQNEDDTPEQSS